MSKEYKDVLFSEDTRKKVKEGIDIAARLISPTLGAKGQKVIIQQEFGGIKILDDGAQILSNIKLKDPAQQAGVEILLDAAEKTNNDVGDGTTTTSTITQALAAEVVNIKKVDLLLVSDSTSSSDILRTKRELQQGVAKIVKFVNVHKINITPESENLVNIGRVSANSEEVGTILATLFKKLGKDASIVTSESQTIDTEYEIIEGLKFDKGFISPAFVTDGEKQQAVIENPRILVTDNKLQNPEDWEKIIELLNAKVRELVIIADDVSGIPLMGLITNKVRAGLRLLAVRAPGFGQSKEYLKDIAILVGATLISKETPLEFKDVKVEHLGSAERVIAELDSTVIVGGKGNKKEIEARLKTLKNQAKNTTSDYEKDKLKERISKLGGGVGVIKVGSTTELEAEEKRAKIEDAINACRGALDDGIVAGGGVTLLRASDSLDDKIEGEAMLKRAIRRPFEQILINADLDVATISRKIVANKNLNFGYDVEAEEFGDMVELGIVDPAKVVKSALQNAVSIALLLLTVCGSIILIRDEKEKGEKLDGPPRNE